jgi:hypothetical protein
MQGPLANRLHLRGVSEREEFPEQRAGAAGMAARRPSGQRCARIPACSGRA